MTLPDPGSDVELCLRRREFLSLKGRLLYGKYCGTRGEGICAENFALHHLRLGETEVVVEFLGYLESRLAELRLADPHGRRAMTERLVDRVRRHLYREIM